VLGQVDKEAIEEVFARMGGLDSDRRSPALVQRGLQRRSFDLKAPATWYVHSERNRWRDNRTDRDAAALGRVLRPVWVRARDR